MIPLETMSDSLILKVINCLFNFVHHSVVFQEIYSYSMCIGSQSLGVASQENIIKEKNKENSFVKLQTNGQTVTQKSNSFGS